MKKIFDTSSLLLLSKDFFEKEENPIIITNITLKELENIKTASGKDSQIKYQTRNILSLLDKYPDKWECLIYKSYLDDWIKNRDIDINNDSKILAAAVSYMQKSLPTEEIIFYTNDRALKAIAKQFFENHVQSIKEDPDSYTGYQEFFFTEEEMADFYTNPQKYGEKLYINEYVNIYEKETNNRVDTLCWTGESFRPLRYQNFSSHYFGDIKPFKNDIYQAMVSDSFLNNKFTMIKGPAGAGKSWLAMGFLFYLLEKGKIDKIIIFCNTVATKNAAKLGSI